MSAVILSENFEVLAEAPGGIDRLRELILRLATTGKLLSNGGRKTNSATGLPETWTLMIFKEVALFEMGKTPPTKDSGFWNGPNSIMWVSIGDMRNGQVVEESKKNVSLRAKTEVFRREPWPAGTLLMSFKLTIGKMSRLGRPAFFNEAIFAFDSGNQTTNEYLFRVLPLVSSRANSKGAIKGSTLNSESISQMQVPIPPVAEQKQIVAKIDELMALCDELEEQQKQRDNLRTAARKSAIDAISTATTTEELETAWKRINNNWEVIVDTPESINSLRELVLSLGTRIGFGVDIQKSPKRKLNEVSHVSWGNLSLTKTSYVEKGQFLAISAAGPDGRIGHAEHDKHTPVISAIGARCGTMFMPDEKFTAIKNTMTVTPDTNRIDNWYLFYALKGSQLPRRGTAQPFLSKTDIENFEITVPSSLEDQRVIVAKVDRLMALCDQLESELNSRSELAEKFARSVVSAA